MNIDVYVTKYSTNVYVLCLDGGSIVIDSGGLGEKIVADLAKQGRKVTHVLITHGHYDHTLDCEFWQKCGAKIYMSSKDSPLIGVNFLGITVPNFDYENITDGQILTICGVDFKVISTAGHTPGSVCFVVEDIIFSGDTLFKGTIGRTDFPLSSPIEMKNSLKNLAQFKGFRVLPGHGEPTTIDQEIKTNPYLKEVN